MAHRVKNLGSVQSPEPARAGPGADFHLTHAAQPDDKADADRQLHLHGQHGHDPTTSPRPVDLEQVHDQMDELADFLRAKMLSLSGDDAVVPSAQLYRRSTPAADRPKDSSSAQVDEADRGGNGPFAQLSGHSLSTLAGELAPVEDPGYRSRRAATGLPVGDPAGASAVVHDDEPLSLVPVSAQKPRVPEGTPPVSGTTARIIAATAQADMSPASAQLQSVLYPQSDSPVARANRASAELARLLGQSSAEHYSSVASPPRRLPPQAAAAGAGAPPVAGRSSPTLQSIMSQRQAERQSEDEKRSAQRQQIRESPRFYGRQTSNTLAAEAVAAAEAVEVVAGRKMYSLVDDAGARKAPPPLAASSPSQDGAAAADEGRIDWNALRAPRSAVVGLSPSTYGVRAASASAEPSPATAAGSDAAVVAAAEWNLHTAAEGGYPPAPAAAGPALEEAVAGAPSEQAWYGYSSQRSPYLWRDHQPRTAHLLWTPTPSGSSPAPIPTSQPVQASTQAIPTTARFPGTPLRDRYSYSCGGRPPRAPNRRRRVHSPRWFVQGGGAHPQPQQVRGSRSSSGRSHPRRRRRMWRIATFRCFSAGQEEVAAVLLNLRGPFRLLCRRGRTVGRARITRSGGRRSNRLASTTHGSRSCCRHLHRLRSCARLCVLGAEKGVNQPLLSLTKHTAFELESSSHHIVPPSPSPKISLRLRH